MQTYLIASDNQEIIREEIEKIKKQINPSSYNTHEITPSPSIGILEARKIKEILGKKTFMGGTRLVIIKEMEKATIQAANALLKILEEPPSYTYFILTTANINNILPTIVSRCQVISSPPQNKTSSSKAVEKTLEELAKILKSTPGDRLIISQNISKTRESATQFLDDLLTAFTYLLTNQDTKLYLSSKEIAQLIKKTTFAKYYLEKNINSKATLDILFLGFPKVYTKQTQVYS